MAKVIAKVWSFASSSGGGKYQTIRYSDGTTSCQCKGWTQRVATDGSRSCKHTRSVDLGTADDEAICFQEYGEIIPSPKRISRPEPKPVKPRSTNAKGKKRDDGDGGAGPAYGKRRIIM